VPAFGNVRANVPVDLGGKMLPVANRTWWRFEPTQVQVTVPPAEMVRVAGVKVLSATDTLASFGAFGSTAVAVKETGEPDAPLDDAVTV
jgi:hypothetical protein